MGGGLRIDVHVQPRSSRNKVIGWADGALKVALTAPPVEGAANAALIEVLADALGLKKREIAVVAGQASRRKIIEINPADEADLKERLARWT